MAHIRLLLSFLTVALFNTPVLAQDLDAMVERGKELYDSDVGCWVSR